MKYISKFFPHNFIITNKELFGIIYSINYFFLQSRFFFLEFLLVSIGFVWNNSCSHPILPLALGICACCASYLSALFLKIPKFYSSPSYGWPPPHSFLIILFSHTCIVWFLSKEIDLGSIFLSVSNMLSVNGHYYSWPFWI